MTPASRRRRSAADASGRGSSRKPRIPRRRPPERTIAGVMPVPASSSSRRPRPPKGAPPASGWRICTRSPSTMPSTPAPGSARNSLTARRTVNALRLAAARRTAAASGCSESASREVAFQSSSQAVVPSAGSTTTSSGRPRVSVPVLSKATVRTRPSTSRYRPPLIRMPWRPAADMPAANATGVDIARAQGAAATRRTTAYRAHTEKLAAGCERGRGEGAPRLRGRGESRCW